MIKPITYDFLAYKESNSVFYFFYDVSKNSSVILRERFKNHKIVIIIISNFACLSFQIVTLKLK